MFLNKNLFKKYYQEEIYSLRSHFIIIPYYSISFI